MAKFTQADKEMITAEIKLNLGLYFKSKKEGRKDDEIAFLLKADQLINVILKLDIYFGKELNLIWQNLHEQELRNETAGKYCAV